MYDSFLSLLLLYYITNYYPSSILPVAADLNAVGYFERLVFLLQSEEFRPFHPRALSVLHRDKIAHLALLELGKARYGHDGMLLISLLNASLMDNSTFTLVLDIINVLPSTSLLFSLALSNSNRLNVY
jgi:hypothetical protein